jgi:hypothetical protein
MCKDLLEALYDPALHRVFRIEAARWWRRSYAVLGKEVRTFTALDASSNPIVV